jgi:hypothetical protein
MASSGGDGVCGLSYSTNGIGVVGSALTTTESGGTFGGWFSNATRGGAGVLGWSQYGIAVWGCGDDSVGVRGTSWSDYGGHFKSHTTSAWAKVGGASYKVLGNGSVSFVQNHPERDDEVIVYAAPEGNEVATYVRGKARLVAGEARVELDDTFRWVTNPAIGLTAHLTPRGNCEGLYVASLSTSELLVRELRDGSSDVSFDYIVYGLRIGFEEQSIVQKKTQDAPIPNMKNHRELYAEYPELRAYNSLERFKAMRSDVGASASPDQGAARFLLQAIGHGQQIGREDHYPRPHVRRDPLNRHRPMQGGNAIPGEVGPRRPLE